MRLPCRSSLQLELAFKNKTLNNSYFDIESKSISIPLLYKRDLFFYKKTSPFILVGMSYNHHFSMKSKMINIDYAYEVDINDEVSVVNKSLLLIDHEYPLKNKNQFGILLGAGLRYNFNKKHGINIEFRGHFNTIKSRYHYLDNNVRILPELHEKSTSLRFSYSYRL